MSLVSLPQGQFTSHLINAQVNYAFFRLDYIYRPGDDFFLIYNELGTVADPTVAGQRNRSIIAKITHSWDLQFQGR